MALRKGGLVPASEVMGLFRKHKLHSGKGGKIVRNKKQAHAILLSYLRSEGKIAGKYRKPSSKKTKKRTITKR